MLWLLLALLTAFFQSLKDVFSKFGLRHINEYVVALFLSLYTFIFLLPLVFIYDMPRIKAPFWGALFAGGILNVIAIILYMKAIKYGDLSLTAPMLTFTPLFLLITSPVLVGEFPNFLSIIGIILIVVGSYVLNLKESHKGYFSPIKAIVKIKGTRYMLLVAFIYSFSSNIDKIGVQNSSPVLWGIFLNIYIVIAIAAILLAQNKFHLLFKKKTIISLMPMGVFGVLSLLCQLSALKLTLVAYVISIKRMSALMGILWGYFLFKEKGLKERFTGGSVMIIGVILISISK